MTDSSLILFLFSIFICVTSSHNLWDDPNAGSNCQNDGFYDGAKCDCPSYLQGDNCEKWECINYGRGSVGNRNYCECPGIIAGAHCEPVSCVGNNKHYYDSFNSSQKSLTLLITFNKKFMEGDVISKADNFSQGIEAALANPGLDRLDIYTISKIDDPNLYPTICSKPQNFSDCYNSYINEIIDFDQACTGPDCKNLTTSDIISALDITAIGAPIVILTTTPLGDYENTGNVDIIVKKAIARRNTIHIIIGTWLGDDIGQVDAAKPYLDLAKKTLGSLIVAHDMLGYLEQPVQNLLPIFLPLTYNSQVIDFGDGPIGDPALIGLQNICGDNCEVANTEFYVAAFGTNIRYENFINATITNSLAPFENIIYTGPTQVQKYTGKDIPPFIKSQWGKNYYYILWVVSSRPAKGVAGYSQNVEAEVSTPIPVEGSPNLIVEHIDFPPSSNNAQFSIELLNTPQNQNASLDQSFASLDRFNCLYNLNFGALQCKNGDYGTMLISSINVSYQYQQMFPFICGTFDDTYASNPFPSFIALPKLDDEVDLESSPTPDSPTYQCDSINFNATTNQFKALDYTIKKRTFGLFLSNNQIFTQALFNTSFNQQFVAVLSDYINGYGGDDYFDNYILNTFNGFTESNPPYKSLAEFRTNLIRNIYTQGYNNIANCSYPQSNVPDLVYDAMNLSILIDANTLRPYSEFFFLTDHNFGNATTWDKYTQLLGQLGEYKIKLNFIIYRGPGSCQADSSDISKFYYFAWRTNGLVFTIDQISDISQIFSFYNTIKAQNGQIVLTEYKKDLSAWQNGTDPIFGNYSFIRSQPFKYVSGRKYAVFVHNTGILFTPEIANISTDNGITLDDGLQFMLSSNFLVGSSLWRLPNLAEGDYHIITKEAHKYAAHPYLLKLIEYSTDDDYYTGFASATSNDADVTFPEYQKGISYPVIHSSLYATDTNESYKYTIYYTTAGVNDTQIFTGSSTPRASCSYEQMVDYAWKCTQPQDYYYIRTESQTATRTEIIPCYSITDETNPCLEGQPDLARNVCICNAGYTGDRCQVKICSNGGTANIDNTCTCPPAYTGASCDISSYECVEQTPIPAYGSEIKTLILILEVQPSGIIVKNIQNNIGDLDAHVKDSYRQFVLGYYFCVGIGEKSYQTKLFTDYIAFKTAILEIQTNLPGICPSPTNAEPVIRDALKLASTPRSLLFWLGSEKYSCSNGSDASLMQQVANKRAEIRVFYDEASPHPNCFQKVASLGNGLAVRTKGTEWRLIPSFISTITPYSTDVISVQQRLTVLDHVNINATGDLCTFNSKINLVSNDPHDIIIYVNNLAILNTNPNATQILTNVYKLTVNNLDNDVSISFKNASSNLGCGYSIETFEKVEYAYGYAPLQTSSTPRKFAFSNLPSNQLIYYVRNSNISNAIAEITPIDPNTGFYMVPHSAPIVTKRPDNCRYQTAVEFNCSNIEGPIKTKVYSTDGQYHITFPTHCFSSVDCGRHGRPLPSGDCLCFENWYGSDCSVPKCLNDGVSNGLTCNCKDPFYGYNCENDATHLKPAKRNILILFDSFTDNTTLLDARKQLVQNFTGLYADNSLNHFAVAFNSNTTEATNVALTTTKATIINEINKITKSEGTLNLATALDFFKSQDLSGNNTINAIFYITHSSYPITQNFSTFYALRDNNVIFWSGIPYSFDNEPVILELSLLGGGILGSTGYNVEIIDAFVKSLKGADEYVPTPTPTPMKKLCENATADIYLIFDDSSTSSSFKDQMLYISTEFITGFKYGNKSTTGTQIGSFDIYDDNAVIKLVSLCSGDSESVVNSNINNSLSTFQPNSDLKLETSLTIAPTLLGPPGCGRNFSSQYLIYFTSHPTVNDPTESESARQNLLNTVKNLQIFGVGFKDGSQDYTWWKEKIVTQGTYSFMEVTQSTDLYNEVIKRLWNNICPGTS